MEVAPIASSTTAECDPEQLVVQAETCELLTKAFEKFGTQDRVLLALRFREALTDAESPLCWAYPLIP